MNIGGRYIDDGKGGTRRVKPGTEEHHGYPKPADIGLHQASAGDTAADMTTNAAGDGKAATGDDAARGKS